MKKELLEYLVRECVVEILETFPEGLLEAEPEGTSPAMAPPADGLGTGDAPAIPKQEPEAAITAPAKGVFFVDPRKAQQEGYRGDPMSRLVAGDPGKLEREIYRTAAKSGGPRVKVSNDVLRKVPLVLSGKMPVIYLYIGNRAWSPNWQAEPAPEGDEGETPNLFVYWAPKLEDAKGLSVAPGVTTQHAATAMTPKEPQTQMPQAGPEFAAKTTAPDIDEGKKHRNWISSIIKEAIRDARKH